MPLSTGLCLPRYRDTNHLANGTLLRVVRYSELLAVASPPPPLVMQSVLIITARIVILERRL
jgi:hypothetical protein